MEALKAIADRHKLVLIEDCAQAWGAKSRGRPIGTAGTSPASPSRTPSTSPAGTAASWPRATNGSARSSTLRRQGLDRLGKSGLFESFATNYRMSEPQAAVAAAQLAASKGSRRSGAARDLLTEGIAGAPGVQTHRVHPEDRCTYWFSMMRLRPGVLRCDRAQFVKALAAEGVPASAGYIPSLYGNPVFREHGFFAGRWPVKESAHVDGLREGSCPEAKAILATGVRVVIHEGMSESYVPAWPRPCGKSPAITPRDAEGFGRPEGRKINASMKMNE